MKIAAYRKVPNRWLAFWARALGGLQIVDVTYYAWMPP